MVYIERCVLMCWLRSIEQLRIEHHTWETNILIQARLRCFTVLYHRATHASWWNKGKQGCRSRILSNETDEAALKTPTDVVVTMINLFHNSAYFFLICGNWWHFSHWDIFSWWIKMSNSARRLLLKTTCSLHRRKYLIPTLMKHYLQLMKKRQSFCAGLRILKVNWQPNAHITGCLTIVRLSGLVSSREKSGEIIKLYQLN